jgi:transposase-like protein
MTLIPFAGRESPVATKMENAYRRSLSGADTSQIARHYKCSEATILKWVNIERSRKLGLPVPYPSVERRQAKSAIFLHGQRWVAE